MKISKIKKQRVKEMIERGHDLATIAEDLDLDLDQVVGVIKNGY